MTVRLLHGDCVDLMRGMPENSVDAIVTDPPYGLEFMGKDWDAPWKAKPSREFNEIEEGTLGGFSRLPNHSRVNNVRCEACQRWKFSSNPCQCAEPKFPNARLDALTVFQQWFTEVAAEALRVLKPGGHLLAFGGTRTYHRMACAIEDAGFEIRDSIHWVYGSGFPKSLDVSKAIDKANGRKFEDRYPLAVHIRERRKASGFTADEVNEWFGYSTACQHWESRHPGGARVPSVADYEVLKARLGLSDEWDVLVARVEAEREVVRTRITGAAMSGKASGEALGTGGTHFGSGQNEVAVTAPATDEARRWEGWGTALKPAHEPVVVARKPLSGTVAGNVLVWGTGGLNIDGCRVGTQPRNPGFREPQSKGMFGGAPNTALVDYESASGRWPANVVFDRAAGEALDAQSGVSKDGVTVLGKQQPYDATSYMISDNRTGTRGYGGEGGASRFFTQADFGPDDWPFVYQAKPSRKERNAGLDGLPLVKGRSMSGAEYRPDRPTNHPERQNHHPTVKPVALMRHLVRLVTPPGGVVLDPFAGSGTTLVAAVLEGFDAVGCEMTDEYLPIIEGRVAWAEEQAELRGPEQTTLL